MAPEQSEARQVWGWGWGWDARRGQRREKILFKGRVPGGTGCVTSVQIDLELN